MFRLALAVFAVQAGFHAFTASLPVALARAGVPDAQIGLIVGAAALVQIPAAFVTGVVIDRVGGIRGFTAGGLAYLVGCLILLLPGGGLVITPLLIELSRRSRSADRGSAFSLFSAANATALAIGSIGGALIVTTSGFAAAMVVTFLAIVLAGILTAFDPGLRCTPTGRHEPAAI